MQHQTNQKSNPLNFTNMFLIANTPFTTISEARKRIGIAYLGGINTSSKLMKNQTISGHYTYIVYLAPADTSGVNVCPFSTPECRAGCLATSGRAAIEIRSGGSRIQSSRIRKTLAFHYNQELYMNLMVAEIKAAQIKAKRDNFFFSVRLNGTSDIDYAKVLINGKNIFDTFPDVPFYDYTKNPNKFKNKPANYHLTLSYSGWNWDECKEALDRGDNVAMVFNYKKSQPLPTSYAGYPVINGDLTDLRIDEAKGIIVGLYWKNIADPIKNKGVKYSIFAIQSHDKNINH